ncbi:hypothetical protein [Alteromonas sp. a30]|uniref:hypothetical protein n=1 Tax=Alteromonas sp. a30 TaxID=2730917 RepID=UPI0022817555|nr:hypothetical protein [Alteromonas sp. a30]MCY7295598.1 hypothetical protein [Alteromonas sp. a30]
MTLLFRYSCLYFMIVFACGFILGTIRVLLLAPNVGEHLAELLEAPFMIGISFLSARLIWRWSGAKLTAGNMLVIGVLALVYLLAVEFTLVIGLRNITLAEYLQSKYSFAGFVYLVSLTLFAIFPYLIANHRRE